MKKGRDERGRFQKGHIPWNKGLRIKIPRCCKCRKSLEDKPYKRTYCTKCRSKYRKGKSREKGVKCEICKVLIGASAKRCSSCSKRGRKRIHTEETKKRISEIITEKWKDSEYRRKQIEARKRKRGMEEVSKEEDVEGWI